jgi:membrane-associated protease RseP (regulator of RpoE activity)
LINRDGVKREVERSLAEAEPLLRQYRIERQPPVPGRPGLTPPRPPQGGTYMFDGPNGEALVDRLNSRLSAVVANRGRLGVTIQELTPELATYFGVKDGVLVATVRADSPAARAGIKVGDVITAVNDKPIPDGNTLVAQIGDKEGDVTIGLSRDKKAMSVKATLEKATPSKPRIVVRRTPG